MIGYYPIQGGEDHTSPSLSVDPGRLIFSRNYECDSNGRPRRIDGYERFDGQPKPSDASYWVLYFDAGEGEISVGDTVEGGTSSATGEVIVVNVESGAWGTSDAAGYLVLFNLSGSYQNDEDLEVSSVKKAVAANTEVEGEDGDTYYDTWIQAAIEATREDIQAVPGSGAMLGVWQYNGTVYAFRKNSGGSYNAMYKSSTSGWTECDLGRTIAFTSGGTHEVLENDTLTGATSGATAVVKRIILSSGTWAGGDAAGTFVLYSQSGTFQSENLNEGANSNVCTIAGNSTATTLVAGGRYDFINYNFGGHSGTYRMYGCNGVDKAFEWDGSVFVPITTGMTTDKPTHIIAHEGHLFLSFTGGSLQHSSITDPYTWSAVTGAAELGMGSEVTGFLSMPKALAIFTKKTTKILYGTSTDDWDLRTISDDSGAIEWAIQKINSGVYLNNIGITTLSTTDQYGDFYDSIISDAMQPVIENLIESILDNAGGITYIASMNVKKKSQYRLFSNLGTCIILTFNKNKIAGYTRIVLDHTVTCCASTEDSYGNEELYFGSSNGMVYQMDSGTSFDGSAVISALKLHYNHLKVPRNKKRFRSAAIELESQDTVTLNLRPELNYGNGYDYTGDSPNIATWTSDFWIDPPWDDQTAADGVVFYIDGSGKNISFDMYVSSTYTVPHTLYGVVLDYEIRGLDR